MSYLECSNILIGVIQLVRMNILRSFVESKFDRGKLHHPSLRLLMFAGADALSRLRELYNEIREVHNECHSAGGAYGE